MKKTIISLVLLLIAVCGWAQKVWEKPTSFFGKDPYFDIKVCKVEFLDKETVLHLDVIGSGGRFQFAKETYLKTPDDKQYHITNGKATQENEKDLPLSQWYDVSETHTYVALHFEPLPADVERFHLIEGPWPEAFRIWNITEGKTADMSELFNSNWRDEQTGDWVLGLYADNVVYDSKVWKYEEKSDKKVVLTNGQDKTTINIGKEKNGKRQFTINGQKLSLSSFGSVLPAYPTADNTAFSTELANGEATIVGWIKDFPKDISDKKITLSANATNLVTAEPMNVTVLASDEMGQFTMTVKLNGAQSVTFGEIAGNSKIFAKELVLEPGKKYYMVHDWKNGSYIFMGENARLENELVANPCNYETNVLTGGLYGDEITAFKDKCVVNYEKATNRLNEIIAKNPNISKRYRDYINEKNRIAAAFNIQNMLGRIEENIICVSDKLGAFNPELPISLVLDFMGYHDERVFMYFSKARDVYAETPELFFSFEEKGKIKFSDSERDFLKRWQKRQEIAEKARTKARNRAEYQTLTGGLDSLCSYEEFRDFLNKENIRKVYKDWVPDLSHLTFDVMDSLYSDQIMRDYCRAYMLGRELVRDRGLREGRAKVVNEIKNRYLNQYIVDLKNHYEELARQNEEIVKNVIAPSSNVEGLTDGKAIIDKIIEPYKGKIVYMDIWGTWCQPCINAIKSSPKLKEAVKDYDLVYVYFAGRSEEAAWKGCIAELGLTKPNYVHYNLPQDQQDAVFKYLDLDGFPFYVLFDKQGNMEKLDRGHIGDVEGFKKKIEELSKK